MEAVQLCPKGIDVRDTVDLVMERLRLQRMNDLEPFVLDPPRPRAKRVSDEEPSLV